MRFIAAVILGGLSTILALMLAATGVRNRISRQNFKTINRPYPRFYRLRLGFHLARDFLSLVSPGSLAQTRVHPRSRAALEVLRGGPSLLLTAHFGNWEAQAAAWGRHGVRLLGAARPLKSRAAHTLLAKLRARHGIHVVTASVPRTALRHLGHLDHLGHEGRNPPQTPGCFGILWDQHAPDSTRPGTFFGEPVSLNPLPFFLLERCPCPVHFGVLLPDGTLRLVPLLTRFNAGWEDRLSRRYHRVLEVLIRCHPTRWHGALHARFKMTRVYAGHRGK